ncbi:MAG: hypothetical protein NC908_00295 [Candidatus Omnitrophica bacterium]|nr:hypothetical protein [Candidatus Omnitrophota bacterium]
MNIDEFFDRKQYLEILDKRIRSLKEGYRQNIAIIGDETVGKTSILMKFLNMFYDPNIIMLYLELRPESLESFTKRFIGVLLYNFLINSNTQLKEDLNFLINESSRYIPLTIEKAKNILSALQRKKKSNIFTDLLSLCELIHQETNKSCVVVFDEFNHLENLGIKGIYAEWAKTLVLQKNTMYILVSSMKFKSKVILSKSLSLLFGNFETINIEPFDIKTSEQYLRYKIGANLDQAQINFLIHFTGGYPFYLRIISDEIKYVGQGNLIDILEKLLFTPSGILNQRFSNYIKRFLDSPYSQEYISMLYLIASGHNKYNELNNMLHKPKREINIKVNHLLESDVISRIGDFLKINDRVFGFWLRFVYQEKLNSFTFNTYNQRTLFRKKIETMIQEFISNTQKSALERIKEVLHLFSDEVVQIERKRLRFTHFREIKPLEFNNCNVKEGLIGRSQDGIWIVGIKMGHLTEEDISGFAKECKRYRYKLQKKIIIAFRDIDINAKLRALNEKILTLDLDNFNQLLDLFSKPRIIL